MDFISGPQDDGSADELCRIDRRDFSHRRLTTCTWCRGYIWHDSPRGDIFYVLIWIYIFVFCFKIFMTPTLSMRNVPQNVQSPGFWQRWYYKKLYKKNDDAVDASDIPPTGYWEKNEFLFASFVDSVWFLRQITFRNFNIMLFHTIV